MSDSPAAPPPSGPIYLCAMRTDVNGVDHGNTGGGKGVTLKFVAVHPTHQTLSGKPRLTDEGFFSVHFVDEETSKADAFEVGKRYWLVPALEQP